MARNNGTNSGKMTRQEAGRKGGQAPHVCRGFECQQKGSSSSRSSR